MERLTHKDRAAEHAADNSLRAQAGLRDGARAFEGTSPTKNDEKGVVGGGKK